jgi:hypothetical protein
VGAQHAADPVGRERVGDHQVAGGGQRPVRPQGLRGGDRVDLAQRARQRHRVAGEQRAVDVRAVLAAGRGGDVQQHRDQRAGRDEGREPGGPRGVRDVPAGDVRQLVREHRPQLGQRQQPQQALGAADGGRPGAVPHGEDVGLRRR